MNVIGVYHTLRAAGPHISHPDGYALPVASLAAAVHLPLLGAYSASKAAVEALGNTLRVELAAAGAKVGVAYFAELDTDMTSRGFGTEAAAKVKAGQDSARRAARGGDRRARARHRAPLAPRRRPGGSARCCRCGWRPAVRRPGRPAGPARRRSRSPATSTSTLTTPQPERSP